MLGYVAVAFGHGCIREEFAFPPPERRYRVGPVRGSRLTPGQAACVVIGLQPVRNGVFQISGFTLHYHIGSARFEAHYFQSVKICVPAARGNGPC